MEASAAASGALAQADWNVVVTLPERTFQEAWRVLRKWGKVKRTPYYNVIAMTVEDPSSFLSEFKYAVAEAPGILNFVSHVVPARQTFEFGTADEFKRQARNIAISWAPELAGKSFHVRLHRRGFHRVLSSHVEEKSLAEELLAVLGASAHINFDDPDAIVQIETIDGRAGMSLWTREDLHDCPFFGVD
jgi:tRNA(Ser,Leu) C12 N-acetylase TAN1